MSEKLDRLARDLKKARDKRAGLDKKIRYLEERYREQENTEIHDMVREANLTPEELAELILRAKVVLPQTKDSFPLTGRKQQAEDAENDNREGLYDSETDNEPEENDGVGADENE